MYTFSFRTFLFLSNCSSIRDWWRMNGKEKRKCKGKWKRKRKWRKVCSTDPLKRKGRSVEGNFLHSFFSFSYFFLKSTSISFIWWICGLEKENWKESFSLSKGLPGRFSLIFFIWSVRCWGTNRPHFPSFLKRKWKMLRDD